MDEETPRRRPSIKQLSKTPSWVMLGFLLGVVFVWALPRREPAVRTVIVREAPPEKTRPDEPPLLTTVEAVFTDWDEYAVWDNNRTQVAMWNVAVGEFAEFYEVLRVEGTYYFRSIPRLTNRVIRHGKPPPPECPLRFTETEEQYQEWRQQGRYERPAEDYRPSPPKRAPALPIPSAEAKPIAPEISPRGASEAVLPPEK